MLILFLSSSNIYLSQNLQDLQKLKSEYEKFKNTTPIGVNPLAVPNNINTSNLNPKKRSFSLSRYEASISDSITTPSWMASCRMMKPNSPN